MVQILNDYRRLVALNPIQLLRDRLVSMISNEGPASEHEKHDFKRILAFTEQLLIKMLKDTPMTKNMHTFGEITAEENADQVVGTTCANVFDVRKATAKKGSGQLIVSTTLGETLQPAVKRSIQ